jgi:putative acetyltransferase
LLHLCPLGIIASPVECRCAREDKISGDFDPREYDPRHVMAAMAHRTANVVVRSMRVDEARRFLEIHRAAVRELAVKDYPPSVIDQWPPLPITDAIVERFLTNPDDEIRLIAVLDGATVGIGALVTAAYELRACYVVPDFTRLGVGAAIASEIERIARQHRLDYLQLESSVTAEPFYAALGYRVVERGEHVLASGTPMRLPRCGKSLSERGSQTTLCVAKSLAQKPAESTL